MNKINRLSIISIFVGLLAAFNLNALGQEVTPPFDFACAPYLQNVGMDEATIVFAFNRDGVGWVELTQDNGLPLQAEERAKHYEDRYGKKKIGKLHKVRITGLQPGQTYIYRVCGKEVVQNIDKNVRYGQWIKIERKGKKVMKFSTLANSPGTRLRFGVVNDIHEDSAKLRKLLLVAPIDSLDFMVYNGDMANKMNSFDQCYQGFLNTTSDVYGYEKPFYMARGNHETRGPEAQNYGELFPTPTAEPYYAFVRDGVFFLVLDGGEDKPDSDIEYDGLAQYDEYRTREAEWLKKIVETDEYKNAKARIVFLHIPPYGKAWHGTMELKEKILPILNEAGVDLMFSGHIHKKYFSKKGENGYNFPILVNSTTNILVAEVGNNAIDVKVVNRKGVVEDVYKFDF